MASQELIINHLSIPCSDTHKSKDWYLAALATFNVKQLMTFPEGEQSVYGLGVTHPTVWIHPGGSNVISRSSGHICFQATSRAQVDQFHADAVRAGGEDNGKPGVRMEYHPTYYAAFVRDPDGKNVEVVCFNPVA